MAEGARKHEVSMWESSERVDRGSFLTARRRYQLYALWLIIVSSSDLRIIDVASALPACVENWGQTETHLWFVRDAPISLKHKIVIQLSSYLKHWRSFQFKARMIIYP